MYFTILELLTVPIGVADGTSLSLTVVGAAVSVRFVSRFAFIASVAGSFTGE